MDGDNRALVWVVGLVSAALVSIVSLNVLTPNEPETAPESLRKALEACAEVGGVPIVSDEENGGFDPDERLKECKIPGK